METIEDSFSGQVWEYSGKGSWYFITLPLPLAKQIKFFHGSTRPGFGSVRVEATVGDVVWKTSVFPDSKSGSYFLPVKAEVRKRASLKAGDMATVQLKVPA